MHILIVHIIFCSIKAYTYLEVNLNSVSVYEIMEMLVKFYLMENINLNLLSEKNSLDANKEAQ